MASRFFRWAAGILLALVLLLGAVRLSFELSPWPSALLIRRAFGKDQESVRQAHARLVPAGLGECLDERYDPGDDDGWLDVFFPGELKNADGARTTVVWTHGGGFVSGQRQDVANYARILAGRGFTVAAISYSIAPRRTHPTPARQLNAALGYLARNAARLHVDPSRFVLAGDSAGAHISAQVAALLTVPDYAQALGIAPALRREQLAGVLLFCGPYDVRLVSFEGPAADFLRTVLWSYSGQRDFRAAPGFENFSLLARLTKDFPPAFLTAGNADPLEPHSQALAQRLTELGVRTDTLFFPKTHQPPLGHEYQFHLETEAGKQALDRAVQFLRSLPARTRPAE